jgi:hypothetical protein
MLSLSVAGCEPTCKQTCRTLLDCEEVSTARLDVDECAASCEIQEQLYEDWEDNQLRDAFGDLKTCIQEEECDAIADGACYDSDLFIW